MEDDNELNEEYKLMENTSLWTSGIRNPNWYDYNSQACAGNLRRDMPKSMHTFETYVNGKRVDASCTSSIIRQYWGKIGTYLTCIVSKILSITGMRIR